MALASESIGAQTFHKAFPRAEIGSTNPGHAMTNAAITAQPWRITAGVLVGCAWAGFFSTPTAAADPPATCQGRHVDGVEEDVCVGIPGVAGGANPRDLYPRVVPELYFGVGIGF